MRRACTEARDEASAGVDDAAARLTDGRDRAQAWHMRFKSLFSFLLLVSACTAQVEPAAPVYEPLVCDPAAADHVAFGFQISGAMFGSYAERYYGRHFLLVDGSCRFYVDDGLFGQVRGGVLTPDEVSALNAELLTGPWEAIDGEHRVDVVGADAWTYSLWRDGLGASCYQSCGAASSSELRAMLATASRWEERLTARGVPLDGDVRLVLRRGSGPVVGAPTWTGATSLADAVPVYVGSVIVSDPADIAALRALRAALPPLTMSLIELNEAGVGYSALVLDVMPHASADGRLLPPFPITDYPPSF
jgi:hypothetical protein